MMENVLFDSNSADKLNKYVQSKIAPHLFVVCNYNPNTFDAISADAKFLQGIANLYKFTIDTSIINKINNIDYELGGIIWRKKKQSVNGLKNHIELISQLRTYAFHNNDHNIIIDITEEWLIRTIHKKKFETINDYTLALRELERMGDKTYSLVMDILNEMLKVYSRDDLREKFQNQIILFYAKDQNRLFKEELRATYKARVASHGNVSDKMLAAWCQKMYVGEYEEKINTFSSYLAKTKGAQRKKIEMAIEQYNTSINSIKKAIANHSNKCKGDIGKLSIFDYMDFYLDGIIDKCKREIPNLSKYKLTMLPQDIIQHIISEDFKTVSTDI